MNSRCRGSSRCFIIFWIILSVCYNLRKSSGVMLTSPRNHCAWVYLTVRPILKFVRANEDPRSLAARVVFGDASVPAQIRNRKSLFNKAYFLVPAWRGFHELPRYQTAREAKVHGDQIIGSLDNGQRSATGTLSVIRSSDGAPMISVAPCPSALFPNAHRFTPKTRTNNKVIRDAG